MVSRHTLIYLEKSKQIFYISILGMLASLGLNRLMVPRFGAHGAAISSVITYSIMSIVCFLDGSKILYFKT
jgi:O-antigen/teichoic acid export membrane protein